MNCTYQNAVAQGGWMETCRFQQPIIYFSIDMYADPAWLAAFNSAGMQVGGGICQDYAQASFGPNECFTTLPGVDRGGNFVISGADITTIMYGQYMPDHAADHVAFNVAEPSTLALMAVAAIVAGISMSKFVNFLVDFCLTQCHTRFRRIGKPRHK